MSEEATTTHKGRILCTEDDADTRDLLRLLLEVEGFEVICADDAAHAISLAMAENFDLYLLDNWMPGIDGNLLCRKLREFDSTTPILFYSGAAFESDKARAMEAGAQGYIVKPAPADELTSEILRLIPRKE
ncbi:MAG TPA: response regulator [Pyrinomonadaceae bacterium]|nr:response regulator [Pyrinomonadaceae bacterium]